MPETDIWQSTLLSLASLNINIIFSTHLKTKFYLLITRWLCVKTVLITQYCPWDKVKSHVLSGQTTDSRHWIIAGLVLAHRLQRWSKTKPRWVNVCCVLGVDDRSDVQNQNVVSAYFTSKQILPFGCAYCWSILLNLQVSAWFTSKQILPVGFELQIYYIIWQR